MSALRLTPALCTHRGMRRPINQDSLGFKYPSDAATLDRFGALFVVADGVAGMEDGEVASQFVVEGLLQMYYESGHIADSEERLGLCIQRVNAALFNQSGRSATTLLAAVLQHDHLIVASIGDSIAFRVRGGRIKRLVQPDVHPPTSETESSMALRRAVGFRRDIDVETLRGSLKEGDRILLCSDGLTRYLDPEYLRALCLLDDPRDSVHRMIDEANRAGGADNISALLIRVGDSLEDEDLPEHVSTLLPFVSVETPVMAAPEITKPATSWPSTAPDESARESAARAPVRSGQMKIPTSLILVLAGASLLALSVFLGARQMSHMAEVDAQLTQASEDMRASQASLLEAESTPEPDATASATVAGTLSLTQSAASPAPEQDDALIAPATRLQIGQSVLVRVRIDSTVVAFVTSPTLIYTVQDSFVEASGAVWYRIFENDSGQTGWVSGTDLTDYRLINGR